MVRARSTTRLGTVRTICLTTGYWNRTVQRPNSKWYSKVRHQPENLWTISCIPEWIFYWCTHSDQTPWNCMNSYNRGLHPLYLELRQCPVLPVRLRFQKSNPRHDPSLLVTTPRRCPLPFGVTVLDRFRTIRSQKKHKKKPLVLAEIRTRAIWLAVRHLPTGPLTLFLFNPESLLKIARIS